MFQTMPRGNGVSSIPSIPTRLGVAARKGTADAPRDSSQAKVVAEHGDPGSAEVHNDLLDPLDLFFALWAV
ncbi:MAG: hypothetical protein U5K81_00060 [Trueperaceae bacterium]|nr:hypothetical protein [Trueperaceae bacterium]